MNSVGGESRESRRVSRALGTCGASHRDAAGYARKGYTRYVCLVHSVFAPEIPEGRTRRDFDCVGAIAITSILRLPKTPQ
ncbi:hypothetical protein AB0758_45985 [Tolypothrix bouteillei VB521301_2]|uniref:Transposase n=1 Tax=Tolypothrix bouteillei VB521301 TaxID=1479485 RepID=A0A0C1R2C8_9CYAN